MKGFHTPRVVASTVVLTAIWATIHAAPAPAQAPAPPPPPSADTTVIDADGTARITRVVPVPRTVSPEAQAHLATGATWAPGPSSPEAAALIARAEAMYPVKQETRTVAGVPTRVFSPLEIPADRRDRILINLHGGGFTVDSGSYLESIPIANLTRTPVISVYYRLATVAPFPAAVDDVVAVYRELLKTYRPEKIAIYGTSAGAILTAQVAVRLKHDRLPIPAALGFFTGHADFSRAGDSHAFFAVPGLVGARVPEPESNRPYMAGHDPRDPLASPIYADLTGLPPTLCITGTRDQFLSATSIFHLALLRAGVDARLLVFEAMPHAFWYEIGIPESKEALAMMAQFFDDHLGRAITPESRTRRPFE